MYTIQFLKGGTEKRDQVLDYLQARIAKDGRFRCVLERADCPTKREDRRLIGSIYSLPSILVHNVRLVKAKPYCGNHPGECPVSDKPKPVSHRLEWEDWVAFHQIVNRALNRFKSNANVWSLPYDVRGRMWIRKGRMARLKYDWTEEFDSYGRAIRYWNPGTEDQFRKD